MVLTENVLNFGFINRFLRADYPLIGGALTIFKGAVLQSDFVVSPEHYAQPATGADPGVFVGIANTEKTLTAAQNPSGGDNKIDITPAGSNAVFLFEPSRISGVIALSDIGSTVYIVDDEKITLTVGLIVGTILFVDENGVFVKI